MNVVSQNDTRSPRPSGHLHWYHWAVVSLSLVLTLGAWYITTQQVRQKTQAQFDYQANQILELVQERMAQYEEALWAGVAALNMFPDKASRGDWKTFATNLQVETRFPGINGIGVIHYIPPEKKAAYLAWQREAMPGFDIHPTHQQNEYWPITYIEPQANNMKAVGLDMAHESNRYSAAKNSRETGEANITGPIILVQDARKTPGFLFYAPWYGNSSERAEYGATGGRFFGLVYAPFIMYKLMDGALANTNRQINFSIHDGPDELYNELTPDSEDYDPDPMFKQQITLQLYGRPWTFTVQSSQLFRLQNTQNQPMLILIGGLLIDSLLLTIFIVFSRANQRAVRYADKVTEDLRLRQQELERTRKSLEIQNTGLAEANRELDQFAFVASHDLKAPLRGISQLTQWIEEDLEEKLSSQTEEYMRLIKSRIQRLENLLDDLLDYSRVGRKHGHFETFNVEEEIKTLFSLLNPPPGFKLECHDDIGQITSLKVPFELIIRNLMENAIKHHDRNNGLITVRAGRDNGQFCFSVEDDGPGVAPEFQDKVFELFHTLKPRDEVEGSGLGLSIIKKTLDRYECTYSQISDGKRGYCFRFSWPDEHRLKELCHD